jgi:integrase
MYSGETIARIVNCVPDDIRPAIILVASNLFRMGEAHAMTYEQLFRHWDAGWMLIPDSAAGRIGRRSLSRWVPINPATRHLLTPYVGQSGPLCPRCKTENAFSDRYAAALKRAGIPIVRAGLRKACISAHSAIGVSARNIASWAGNSERLCTSHYLIPASTRADAAAWAAGLLGVRKDSPAVEEFFAAVLGFSRTPLVFLKTR